jgi:hypothetical protein
MVGLRTNLPLLCVALLLSAVAAPVAAAPVAGDAAEGEPVDSPGSLAADSEDAPWRADVGGRRPRARYRFTWYADEQVDAGGAAPGMEGDLGLTRHDFSISTPVHQTDRDEWSLTASLREESLDTDLTLPDGAGADAPGELWAVRFGGGYRHRFDNDWIAGLTARVGSASDEPFADADQVTGSASGMLRIPVRRRDAVILTLSFSNNTDFLNRIPIPGVAYLYWPNDRFRALVGFPFVDVMARPTDRLRLDVYYRFLYTAEGRVTCRLAEALRAFAGYGLGNESYFLNESAGDDLRLFYTEQRGFGGLGVGLTESAEIEAGGGYAFDRSYSLSDERNFRRGRGPHVDVDSGPFASAAIRVRF